MQVYLNGQIVAYDQAQLRADDAAVQHAVGLFETMLAIKGKVFQLEAHLDRLIRSAQVLGISDAIDRDQLADAIAQTLDANDLPRARVRLTWTPGAVSLLHESGGSERQPTVLVTATEPMAYDPMYFDQGVTVAIAGACANPFDPTTGHKTLAYWARLRTLRDAAQRGAAEAIWLTVTNHVASGAVSNLFIVKDGVLITPIARGEEVEGALPAPVLPGTVRQAVIDQAQSLGIQTQRKTITVQQLMDADEVFLTNSGWLVLPVAAVEARTIGASIGPMTRQLRMEILKQVEALAS